MFHYTKACFGLLFNFCIDRFSYGFSLPTHFEVARNFAAGAKAGLVCVSATELAGVVKDDLEVFPKTFPQYGCQGYHNHAPRNLGCRNERFRLMTFQNIQKILNRWSINIFLVWRKFLENNKSENVIYNYIAVAEVLMRPAGANDGSTMNTIFEKIHFLVEMFLLVKIHQ